MLGYPSSLTGHGTTVRAQQGERDPSQEWIGVVGLMEAIVVSVPPSRVAAFRERLAALRTDELVDPQVLVGVVGPFAEILGPASLAYTDANCFTFPPPDGRIGLRPPGHHRVLAFIETCGAADAEESGMAESTSPVFTIEDSDAVIAASGYRSGPRSWPT